MGLIDLTPLKAGKGPFTPASIANLNFWLDATNSGSITQSVGLVSQWNDLSGNGYNFVQNTALNQPSYTASGINSKASVVFNTSQYMTNATTTSMLGTAGGAFTIVIVCQTARSGAGQSLFGLGAFATGSSGNCPEWGFCNGNSPDYKNVFFTAKASGGLYGANKNTNAAFGSALAGIPVCVSLTFDGSSTYDWYLSNVLKSGNSTAADDTNTTSTNWLGCLTGGGSLGNVLGPIGEYMIYTRVLNSTELGELETYTSAKWGV